MSTVMNTPSVLVGGREKTAAAVPAAGLDRLASWGVLATGLIMTVATAIDLGILWLLQRQSLAQWEVVATSSTLDALPRLVLGITCLYIALHLRRTQSLLGYRVLAVMMVILGIMAIGFGIILTMAYFALMKMPITASAPETIPMLRSIAIKAIALSGVYALILVPLGVLGLRRPRG